MNDVKEGEEKMTTANPKKIVPAFTPPPVLPTDAALAHAPELPEYMRPASDGDKIGDIRFRRLIGETDWRKLPRSLRTRFAENLGPGESMVFQGRIVETRMSVAGWALAQLARLFGAPLPLARGNEGAPAMVMVSADASGAGQFWTRAYGRGDKSPQVITSAKRFAGSTGLEELVGGGFGVAVGMALRLETRWHKLLFISDHYFLKAFGKRWPLPGWATPGKLTVGHEDLGRGRFSFTLIIDHPLFGRMLRQECLFQDQARPPTQTGGH